MDFKPGDLVVNDRHPGCVYLIVEVANSLKDVYPDRFALVLLWRGLGEIDLPTLCATGRAEEYAAWKYKDNLAGEGFKKIGELKGPQQ